MWQNGVRVCCMSETNPSRVHVRVIQEVLTQSGLRYQLCLVPRTLLGDKLKNEIILRTPILYKTKESILPKIQAAR